MNDTITARLERLGWLRNEEGTLCQPPDCPRVSLKVFKDRLGSRYAIGGGRRQLRRLWIRGLHGQIIESGMRWDDPFV